MSFSPYYVLLGIGVGLTVVLFLQNLRLAVQVVLTVGKVILIVSLVTLVGWLFGWWALPRPMAILFFGLRQLWEPFQTSLLDWFSGLFR
jgi:hypothetical protein